MNDTLDLGAAATTGRAPSAGSAWERVKASLVAKGLMDHQGVTAKPKPRHCARCGAAVIAAIDDLGLTVACDPHPTTVAGELDALMRGAATFTPLDGRALVYRTARRIRQWNPDLYDVLVIHECRMPPPPINPTRIRPRRKDDSNAPPPF